MNDHPRLSVRDVLRHPTAIRRIGTYMVLMTLLSLAITYAMMWAFEGIDLLVEYVFIATLIPIVIAPLVAGLSKYRSLQIEFLNARLEHALEHDHLTKAVTRKRLTAEYVRSDQPKVLMLVDADRFKQINDRHGHLAGDEVLIHLAETMRQNVRGTDIVSRWGGEEFVILLIEVQLSDGVAIAKDLIATLNQTAAHTSAGIVPVTVSIGLTECQENEPFHAALGRADAALYEAKQAGRNRYVQAGLAERDRPSLNLVS